MIEALSLPGHRTSRLLFCALKVLGILCWLVGAATMVAPVSADEGRSPGMAALPDGIKKTAAVLTFGLFLLLGVLLLALAQALRYLASIAEAAGRRASAEERSA